MKKLITGVVIGATVVGTTSIFADDLVQMIEAKYMVDKISINGVDTGKADNAFISDGTTYLGVRDISEALGLEVNWDGTTNSIDINSPTNNSSSYISKEQAKQIALDKVGGGEVVYINLDIDDDDKDDRDEYDVKVSFNNSIYEIEIDAVTGQITEYEVETSNSSGSNNNNSNNSSNNNSSSTSHISEEQAKQIALDKVGGGSVIYIKLDIDDDDKDDRDEYDVKVSYNNSIYEIEIDAITGQITEYEVETSGNSSGSNNNNSNNSNNSNTSYITEAQAKQIALDKVGGGEVVYIKLDIDNDNDWDDRDEYEIKVYFNNSIYEFEIDAITGQILEYDVESSNNGNSNSNGNNSSASYISETQAKQVALKKVGGGEVIYIKLDLDNNDKDGDVEYDVKVSYNNSIYELEIDAITGEITEYEVETSNNNSSNNNNNNNSSGASYISEEQAKQIALSKVGGGSVVYIKLDIDDDKDWDDRDEYDIKISYNNSIYEIEIDAITGQITEYEVEKSSNSSSNSNNNSSSSNNNSNNSSNSSTSYISEAQAKQIALDRVGGGSVIKIEFDRDDREYELDVVNGNKEYEITIHAVTGQILEFELED